MKVELLNNTDVDYTDIARYIPDVMNAMHNENACSVLSLSEIRSAFRVKMMQSKAWLIHAFIAQQFNLHNKILVIGGWLGFTSWCLFKAGYNNITEVDSDQRLHTFTTHLNRFNGSFIHYATDVNNVDTSLYDVIINTSCEHMIDNKWFVNVKPTATLILQSNNIDVEDHINKSTSLDDMINKYPLDLVYKGELNYNDGTSRFMLIGKSL